MSEHTILNLKPIIIKLFQVSSTPGIPPPCQQKKKKTTPFSVRLTVCLSVTPLIRAIYGLYCFSTFYLPSVEMHQVTMQDHLGGAGSLQGVPWVPAQLQGEWALLQEQLAHTEAALRAEQHSCKLLREEAEESRGCAEQAQVQLEVSHSRAERLAALVNQANQQRKGYVSQLLTRAVLPLLYKFGAVCISHLCHMFAPLHSATTKPTGNQLQAVQEFDVVEDSLYCS